MQWKRIALLTICIVSLGAMPTNAATFKDVNTQHWYYSSVERLVKHNIISGYGDGTFKPQQPVTRAQAATIIANALRVNKEAIVPPRFTDVAKTNTHYEAIGALTKLGVFQNSEQFFPQHSLTRKQMAKILVEAFKLKSSGIVTYADVSPKSWAYEYIGILGALGITTNQGDFYPNQAVTRAQLAAFIERTIDMKRKDNDNDIWDTWKNW